MHKTWNPSSAVGGRSFRSRWRFSNQGINQGGGEEREEVLAHNSVEGGGSAKTRRPSHFACSCCARAV